ncbi:MAG: glycosyltransferase [Flavobacteriales bacterium]
MISILDVSVIIVNYNVEHFLSQCLLSVDRSIQVLREQGLDGDVWVVDNHSVDGSCAMVRNQFPHIKLMELDENLGFSKANNLAITQSKGRWVLLLNPDTIIQEDTLWKCISYADSQPQLGGLGVPMLDGAGRFLPESKRGIPTPEAAFWKISGLYKLAPKSAKLNRYYLGHLPIDQSQKIEILSGAFMWMKRSVLDEVGLLDESYFMYGEDIDLSWRIMKGGWENHFFADTSIIHYKGESTKKGSLNYVLVFYRAMQIFARNHFAGPRGRAMHALIQMAIYFRAIIAIISRVWRNSITPLLDACLTWGLLVAFLHYYGQWQGIDYDWNWALPATAVYTLVWLVAIKVQGGYDRPLRWRNLLKGVAIGTMVLLATYGLLPEAIRFSRAVFIFGMASLPLVMFLTRVVLPLVRSGVRDPRPKRLFISGPDDLDAIQSMVRSSDVMEPIEFDIAHALSPEGKMLENSNEDIRWLGTIDDLNEAIRIHQFNEVIISGKDVSSSAMIRAMAKANQTDVRFRIAWTDREQIVGEGGPEKSGIDDLDRAIFTAKARRAKRILDVLVSIFVFIGFPILFMRKQGNWLARALEIILGQGTWVGFDEMKDSNARFASEFVFQRVENVGDREKERVLLTYVRDYRWTMDLQVIWEALISQSAIHRHGHN